MICYYCNEMITPMNKQMNEYGYEKKYVKFGKSKIKSKIYFHCKCYKENNENK